MFETTNKLKMKLLIVHQWWQFWHLFSDKANWLVIVLNHSILRFQWVFRECNMLPNMLFSIRLNLVWSPWVLVDADCQADNSVSLKQMCGSATNEKSSCVCLKIGYTWIYHDIPPKILDLSSCSTTKLRFCGYSSFPDTPTKSSRWQSHGTKWAVFHSTKILRKTVKEMTWNIEIYDLWISNVGKFHWKNVPIFYVKSIIHWKCLLTAHQLNNWTTHGSPSKWWRKPNGKKTQFLSAEAQEHILSDKNIQKLIVWIKQCQPSPSHHHFYRCYISVIGGKKWAYSWGFNQSPTDGFPIFALTRVTFVWRFTVNTPLTMKISRFFCVVFDYSNHNLVGKFWKVLGKLKWHWLFACYDIPKIQRNIIYHPGFLSNFTCQGSFFFFKLSSPTQ